MSKKVENSKRKCAGCDKTTTHARTVTTMSWLVHIIMTVITAGTWLFVVAALLVFKSGPTDWVCTNDHTNAEQQVADDANPTDAESIIKLFFIVAGVLIVWNCEAIDAYMNSGL